MAKMMTAQGKCGDFCCPGHNPKSLDHGRQRAREKRQWTREAVQDIAARDTSTSAAGPVGLLGPAQ
jgi:hypothetical protein